MRCAWLTPRGETVAGRLTGAGGREEKEELGGFISCCSVPAVRRAGEACPPNEER